MPTSADAYTVALLKKTGLFTDAQVAQVLAADRADGASLAAVAERLGMAREEAFLQRLAPVLGLTYTALADVEPETEAVQKLPARAVYQYGVMPLRLQNGVLTVTTSDPFNTGMSDGLRLAARLSRTA